MKSLSKYSVLISTLILCGLMFLFLLNLRPKFKEVEANYSDNSRAVNLSKDLSSAELSAVLSANNYVADKREANLIADTITARLKRGLKYPNLYYLQKRAYGQIPALVADSLKVFSTKLEKSQAKLGQNAFLPSADSLESSYPLHQGDGTIIIQLYSDSKADLANAIVQLTEYYYDSLHHACADTIAYTRTDSVGMATFSGLNKAHGYGVLPIKKGFEYGSSKGIRVGKFKNNPTFRFEQLEHRIQMIDNATLKQIKNDGTITVRTPKEYKSEVIKWFVLVLLAWWVLAIFLRRRKKYFDPLLIATAMFLTDFCVIMMFAIQNPLTEELRGVEMASGVLMGIAVIFALQFVDFIKIYQDNGKITFDPILAALRWLFLPFKQKVSRIAAILSSDARITKKLGAMLLLGCSLPFALFNIPYISKINKHILRLIDKLPNGFGWLLTAILLTAMLFTPLGKEVGGMTVNLDLKILPLFQPSEIAKYLIVFFMAAFFTSTADSIIAYSQPKRTNIWNKFKTLAWLLVGLVVLMVIYARLGDMGPALILAVTFLLLYSLVKSKVNLDNMPEDEKWKRIFTCDFAILIYGILSFALFTYIGYKVGNAMVFSLLWFVVWIGVGLSRNKQFFETAFFFNMMVFLFIFGGEMLTKIGFENSDTVIRFEQRTRMCINTWGDLDIDNNGHNAEPVSNTQVANGLWAIATGGMTGQGLGDGNPNLIPAFHTDMILSSIAEQVGWWGLACVVLILALLLRRMIVIGYRVGHPFAFYFCMGVAIVTSVQFFIIALGSSGMIPLTGVTVPFLSYGKVSMILNLVAFGIVLSLSKNIRPEEGREQSTVIEKIRKRSVGDYNYPVSILTWTFIVLALFTLCVWQYYALWARDKTLVQPAFVLNNQGLPLIEYNPRIALLTREMWAGNIYDRNGILLATSDREKLSNDSIKSSLVKAGASLKDIEYIRSAHTLRYYPFAEHMFFMLGNRNNQLYLNSPIGYMAESRHLSYLRDFDNIYYDKLKNPVKLDLKGKIISRSRYIASVETDTVLSNISLYNYGDLKKYLKSGVSGDCLREHNKAVSSGDYDLQLTVDAKLQVEMQKLLNDYATCGDGKYKRRDNFTNNNLLRISVVVLDADNGDLLTSANYPLPNYESLTKVDSLRRIGVEKKKYYYDEQRESSWQAYTDMDLGLLHSTNPGSTAKVMSAMAGLNIGAKPNTKYDIQLYEVIDYDKGHSVEPPKKGNHELVDMKTAIVESSNCYFISLVNDYNLYNELGNIYAQVGIRVAGKRTYSLIYPQELIIDSISPIIDKEQNNAITKWNEYLMDKSEGRFVNGKDKQTMRKGEWMWAWGQGTMDATPLSMARVVSAVVNKGEMPQTRFISTDPYKTHSLTSKDNAKALESFMGKQYIKKLLKDENTQSTIGGKTGTPHRSYTKLGAKTASNMNDGWYVFYADNKQIDKNKHNIAVAVRMERIGQISGNSTDAMWLTSEIVIPTLKRNEYILK